MALLDRQVLRDADLGAPDGFCIDLDGTPIGCILLMAAVQTLCFGGPANNRPFMAASPSDYGLSVNAAGLKGGRNDCHSARLCLSDAVKTAVLSYGFY